MGRSSSVDQKIFCRKCRTLDLYHMPDYYCISTPDEAFRPVLIAEAHNEDTYINAVFVPVSQEFLVL